MKRALALLAAALLLSLAAYAFRGTYTRYRTDDYCTAASLRARGYVDSQRFFRNGWSGRFSYYAIKHALESVGPITARAVPGALVALLAIAGIWTLRRIADPRLAFASGCAVAYATIDAAPEVFSAYGPLLWECGAVTYLLPVVLIATWIGVVLRGAGAPPAVPPAPSPAAAPPIAFLLMLVAGGLSETSLAAQLPLAAGAVILTRNRAAIAGLAGTLVALAIMATAPGNAVRAATLPPPPPLGEAAMNTLALAYRYVGSHLFLDGAALLIVFVLGLLVTMPRRTALGVALTAAVAYVATCAPSAWALSSGPPARALAVSNFFLIVMLFALGAALRAPKWTPALIVAAAVLPILSTIDVVRDLPRARVDAAHADTIDRLLRGQRGRDVVLRSRWALAERFATHDRRHWSNGCVSDYYQLVSLSVTR